MKTLIVLFMLVSIQAFTQGIMVHQEIHIVQLMTVTESTDENDVTFYKFSNTRLITPSKINDTTWRFTVPINEFTMALINESEWIGIKPNGYRYDAVVPFTFGDGLMTVVEFDSSTREYKDNFYGDLIYYKP